MCIGAGIYMPQRSCGGQKQLLGFSSPFPKWVNGKCFNSLGCLTIPLVCFMTKTDEGPRNS